MRTEPFQLSDETYDEFQARQRELRRRRDAETSIPAASFDPLPSFGMASFDTSSSMDTPTCTDTFSGGGGDFGGGGASGDY